ncbi:TetR/AcrR family transcriptional regulator [Amycolatopsis japonica]|uniref:TetR/AcrR family transcriptional regulator n=1 Tax=Amycolatopsis japonica TaxID=208439 RepID=UPI0033C59B10
MTSRDQADTENRTRGARIQQSERREQILAAARKVFTEVGYHAASMGDVAKAADVTTPLLYRHFPGKPELHREVLDIAGDELIGSVANAIAVGGGRESKIAAAVHAGFEGFVEGGPAALLMESEAQGDPEVQARLDNIWRSIARAILDAAIRGAMIEREEVDVLNAVLVGALKETARLWSGNHLAVERSSAERMLTGIIWSLARRTLGDLDDSAFAELDDGEANARAGNRHLIQRLMPVDPQVARSVPVSMYLGSGENAVEVEAAVRAVLDTQGIDIVEPGEPVIGSWFRLMLGRTKKTLTSEQMADLMARVERAIELQLLHKPQAEINAAELDGVAKLITALGKEQNACVQIGSVFLLKVDGTIVSRTVSQREMAFLERNSGLLSTPREVLGALERAAAEAAEAEEVSIEDGAVRLNMQRPDHRGRVGLTISVGDGVTTAYEVGFDAANGPVPVSSGATHVRAHQDKAVIRAEGVTVTVRRLSEPDRRYELLIASESGRATSYELDFSRPRK